MMEPLWIRYVAAGGLLWVCLWLIDVWTGRRQRREGNGTIPQLWSRCALVAVLQVSPAFFGLVVLALTELNPAGDRPLQVAAVATLICSGWIGVSLRTTASWIGTDEELPGVDDDELLGANERIAAELGISPPVIRLIPSGGGELAVQGIAWGLAAPLVAISDGTLLRLDPRERDAILAHELAHIANRTVWFYSAVASLSGLAAVAIAFLFPIWVAGLFGFAVYTGLIRIVSRYFEYDSDRRAAKVIGFRNTVTALDKVHVASPIDHKGWRSFLAYSVATHPSHEERLSQLAAAAPDGDRPEITWSETSARRRRWGGRIAGLLWLSVLVGCVLLPDLARFHVLQLALLTAVILTPRALMWMAVRKDVKIAWKRFQGSDRPRWRLALALAFIAMSLGVLLRHSSLDAAVEIIIAVAIGVLGFMILLGIGLRVFRFASSRAALKIHSTFQKFRWEEALKLGEKHSAKVARDPALSHNLALARWMLGRHDEALAELERLRESFPHVPYLWVTSSLLSLEQGNPSRALELIREAEADLEGDIIVPTITARCGRLRGDLASLEREISVMQRISPDSHVLPAFRAVLALERNQPERTWQFLDEADRLSPGNPFLLLIRAEAELRWVSRNQARVTLEKADRLLEAMPFAFFGNERRRLDALVGNEVTVIESASPHDNGERTTVSVSSEHERD